MVYLARTDDSDVEDEETAKALDELHISTEMRRGFVPRGLHTFNPTQAEEDCHNDWVYGSQARDAPYIYTCKKTLE